MNLSLHQSEIVKCGNGAVLVKAGPGSGKTRVVIERIKYLLHSNPNVNILALTFSNMAANEMKNRVEEDDEIEDKVSNVTIGTLHSFCMDIIQKNYSMLGFSFEPMIFENNNDRKKILVEIITENPKFRDAFHQSALEKNTTIEKRIGDCLNYISELKKKFIFPEKYDEDDLFKELYSEYCETLLAQNAMDFDDILYYAYKLFSENPNITNMYNKIYKYYFVDEAQDLNIAQYMVIKTLCNPKSNLNIMMVGDENQSIYAFNGSDSNIMTKLYVDDYSPTIFELYENFRSAKSIVRYANTLEDAESETNFYYEGEMKFYSILNEDKESEWVVNNILSLKENGHPDIDHKLEYQDFCIIARNRYSLDTIANKLVERNIPFYFKQNNTGILFDSKMIRVYDICIRLIINPQDVLHKKELCDLLTIENSDHNVHELLQLSSLKELDNYIIMLEQEQDFGMVTKKLKKSIDSWDNSDEKEVILKDLDLFLEHWNNYIQQVDRDYRNISSFRTSISLGKTVKKSDQNGIALLTVHMSKGLQYEVVHVVGCSEGSFPDYRSLNNENDLIQEKNNMFVAVTRAKRLCYVTYPIYKNMPWGEIKMQRASRFISNQEIIKIN